MSETTVKQLDAESLYAGSSLAKDSLRRFLRHRSAQVGLFLLGVMLIAAIFAEWIAPYDPIVPVMTSKRRSPPCIHLLGCPADQPEHIMGVDGKLLPCPEVEVDDFHVRRIVDQKVRHRLVAEAVFFKRFDLFQHGILQVNFFD